MRLHHLSVTAFGPFAGREEVDFEELNDAGLFLLTGPTGAGKTSVLDAVCFALYGSVPGVRGVKTLKSHHAGPDLAPEVVLDFTVRDRRFVVRRTPEWERPKRRGSGTVTEKASATLVEKTGGEESFLSSRAQEVGHFVGELLGMNASQFVQVAMLPQGGFQKFLRASSDERHQVLQALFRTDRFTRIEEWVHDHSRRLAARAGDGQATVQRILDTAADRAGAELPEHLAGDGLPAAAADGLALDWLDAVLAEATAASAESGTALEHARAVETGARAAADEARRVLAARQRATEAEATLARLDGSADEATHATVSLARHTAAAPCLPLLTMLDEATERVRRAEQAATALRAGDDEQDVAALTEQLDQQTSLAHRLEGLLPREQERTEADRARAGEQQQLAALRAEAEKLAARRTALPAEVAQAQQQRDDAAVVAGRRDAVELSLAAARERHEAARLTPAIQAEIEVLKDLERDKRDITLSARERVQDLLERRLSGIAAELAGRLEDGTPCQVCGSADHPAPAQPGADPVTEAEQEEAGAAYDASTEDYAAASRAVAEAERQLASVAQAAGGLTEAQAAEQVASLEAALADSVDAASRLREAESRLTALAGEQEALDGRAGDLATRVAVLEQSVATRTDLVRRIDAEIATALDDDHTTVADALTACRAAVATTTRRLAAERALTEAATRRADVDSQATGTAERQGFDDLASVRAAALDPAERTRLEGLLAQRAELSTRARAVLEDDAVRTAAALPADELPDVAAREAALTEAQTALETVTRDHHAADGVTSALHAHRARLVDALDAWAPLRDESLRAAGMAKLVRGMGGGNQLQMRLSAYVLATRLDQVVDAANERLGQMRDQRYLLQRTGRAARKGSQAGLGLEVVDQWTGETRDPSTLSGGETFVVSLSLALGLADVVTHEAGGTEVETLFVDEGFGTLDADTLDDVMDRLDGLRAGGRTVGVVSHVSELRNRIPTQVHLEKGRAGSRIAVRTLTA